MKKKTRTRTKNFKFIDNKSIRYLEGQTKEMGNKQNK